VRRADIDPLFRGDVHPSIGDAAAWENKRMLACLVEHRKLKVAIEGRGCNRLPHLKINAPIAGICFDLDQP
jgi:hypothetical protein